MSASLAGLRNNRILLAAAAAIAIAAVFGAGIVVARATMGSDAPTKALDVAGGPGAAAAKPAIGRTVEGGHDSASGTGGSSSSGVAPGFAGSSGIALPIAPYGGCGAPITAAVLGSAFDPAKMGFSPNMLGAGFTLTGVSFASQGNCGPDGKVQDPHLAMTTQWTYGDGGPTVSVTQVQGGAPAPNVVMPGNASFTAGGSTYSVWANSFAGGPVPAFDAGPLPVTSAPGQDASVAKPAPNIPQPDPRIADAIDAAIAQLAPGIQQCFYRQVEGGWDDLAALGIGDPRGAIPGGFSQQSLNVTRFQAPAAACPSTSAPFDGQANFNATFTNNDSFLQLNAYAAPAPGAGASPPQATQPGRVGDSYASWSNGTFSFDVTSSGPAVTRDVINAIAKALDPNFANACMVASAPMTDSGLAATGVHTPQAPDGYHLDSSTLTSTGSTGDCGGSTTPDTGFALSWMLVSDRGNVIQATAQRGASDGFNSPAIMSDTSLFWTDDSGTAYSVTGLKLAVPRVTLLAVAKSMDPDFSESRLQPLGSGNGGGATPGGVTNPSGPASSPPDQPADR
ncbi:MAG: hypothetical protein ACRDG3_11305 [Tepidiformaceae bacterium]